MKYIIVILLIVLYVLWIKKERKINHILPFVWQVVYVFEIAERDRSVKKLIDTGKLL